MTLFFHICSLRFRAIYWKQRNKFVRGLLSLSRSILHSLCSYVYVHQRKRILFAVFLQFLLQRNALCVHAICLFRRRRHIMFSQTAFIIWPVGNSFHVRTPVVSSVASLTCSFAWFSSHSLGFFCLNRKWNIYEIISPSLRVLVRVNAIIGCTIAKQTSVCRLRSLVVATL